jgi:uncharacterized membrane protein
MIPEIQGSPMETRMIPALLVYVAMALGARLLVFPILRKDHFWTDLPLYAGVYALAIYGTFDWTNYALITNWSLKLAILEPIGASLAFMVSIGLSRKLSWYFWGDDVEEARYLHTKE